MNKRTIGSTGIEVSEVSFGCVEIGMPYGIGAGSLQQMPGEDEALELLRTAFDNGINFFDTARAYGRSESRLGKAFEHNRNEVVICTKCSALRDKQGNLPAPDRIINAINNSLSQSLSELKTDYIDIYMCHNADLEILDHPEIVAAFLRCKENGLARAIGVSTYSTAESSKAIESGIWDVVQLPFNLMDQRQGVLFPLAHQRNVGIVVRSVLLMGILTEKGRHLHPKLSVVEQHRNMFLDLLPAHIPSLSALATAFVLNQQEITSAVIGFDRREHLQDALAASKLRRFDKSLLDKLNKMAYPDPDFLDLRIWDRMGWLNPNAT
ncbi:MAG: aldo/keto reductase [Sedimentisphaerales bacterium]|nr:aldo/keto reductase [Sedimentisphaerales bacterium]